MKKTLFIQFLFFTLYINAQPVFCPKGAQWNYTFNMAFSSVVANEKIQYVRDSVIAGDSVKILQLVRFYKMCNLLSTELVAIKQSGDIVYFRCKETQHNWEILYNFGAAAGDIWQTKILLGNNTMNTYTVQVNSVSITIENGMQLRQLDVDYTWLDLPADPTFTYTQNYKITELFGCSAFLFNYRNGFEATCDGDYFDKFLCYRDSTFGLKQFTNYPCDYEITVGLSEPGIKKGEFKITPNPAGNELNILFDNEGGRKITISDIFGKEILTKQSYEKQLEIDTRQLQSGIYFIKVIDENHQSVHKIIIDK